MSLYDWCNKAIDHCWPNAPAYRDLPFKLQREGALLYWTDGLNDNGRDDYSDDVFVTMGPLFKALVIETALKGEMDPEYLQTQLALNAEEVLRKEIQGRLDDHFRDYCDSNGIHPVDDYCVEARG